MTQIKYLTTEQINLLMANIIDRKDKLMVRILIDTGMRIGEFCMVRYEDLLIDESYIRIPAENTKTKEERTIRINKELMNDLLGYCKDLNITKGYIWQGLGSKSSHLTERAIQYTIKQYGAKIGLDWLTPHKFRHTHIVQALERGVPLPAIMQQAGHKNLQTTQIYSRLAPKEVKSSYERAGL
jgi:integrase